MPGQNCQENQIKETCSDLLILFIYLLSYFFRKVFTFESSCVAEESSILCRLAYRIIWLINYIRSSKVEKVKTINSSSENIDNIYSSELRPSCMF